MSSTPGLSTSLVNLRLEVCRSLGVDLSGILDMADIAPEELLDPRGRIPVHKTLKLWTLLVKRSGNTNLGLLCGLRIRFQSIGPLGYVMMNSKTIREAYEYFGAYQRIVFRISTQILEEEGEFLYVTAEVNTEWSIAVQQVMDFIYAGNATVIRTCSHTNIIPLEVGIVYDEPKDLSVLQQAYGDAKLIFSSEKPYLKYRKSDFDERIINSNPEMLKFFKSRVEALVDEFDKGRVYSQKVKSIIASQLGATVPRLSDIAGELHISERSLQRHLKEEGTTFQLLLNGARKNLAKMYLNNARNSVTDVAFMIGYSDVAQFSRNFKRWTGESPSDYQSSMSN